MLRFAPSWPATRHGFFRKADLGVPKEFASPQLVQYASRSPASVRSCKATATSKSVRHREGRYGIVVSQTLPSLEKCLGDGLGLL
jgi:hypothetical protein